MKMPNMKDFACFTALFLSWTATVYAQSMGGVPTQSYPPIIVSVVPSFGSAEGGTRLTISGTNFQSTSSMFSSTVVYINNQQCKVVDYYTNDAQIVCITPKCATANCLADQD